VSAVDVVRTYLELNDRAQLNARRVDDPSARITRCSPCTVERYRALYRAVGGEWHWRDRLAWTDAELATYLARPDIVVWQLEVDGEPGGYVELRREEDGRSVEIVYFGLVARFFGRGLGGALLTRAVEEAWSMGAERVWLHTCTLDSPRALPNYLARGFREFKRETYRTEI